jgi:hypothetical protein
LTSPWENQLFPARGPKLPDVAATIAALLARRHELEPFARFHMQGHWDPDGSASRPFRAGWR